mgnify:CR=1 FL=1
MQIPKERRGKLKQLLVSTILLLTLLGTSTLMPFTFHGPNVYASGGWLSGWSYRRQLTMNSALIDEDLTSFPVLVKLDSSFFDFSKAKDNGEDIRFTSSDGTTLLKYEIERWNKTAGKAEVWVKMPSVSSTSDTSFYIYYGNPAAVDAQEPTNVWDSNLMMVQHLNETSGTHCDSTSNNNDGSPQGGVTQDALGKIDGADGFDGSNDYVDCGNDVTLRGGPSGITIEAWIYPHSGSLGSGQKATITEKRNPTEVKGDWGVYFTDSKITWRIYNSANEGAADWKGNTVLSANTWYYIVVNYDDSSGIRKIYINANFDAQNTRPSGIISGSASTYPVLIGKNVQGDFTYFNGIIDEVRITNTARTAAWISASYHSGSDSLLTYGSEETPSEAPTFLNIATNTTHASNPCEFQVKWSDPDGLDTCLFTTNNTGAWQQNQTIAVSGTESWANITKILNSTPGLVIGFRWYCNDTKGNIGDTGIQTLTTSGDWQYAMKLTFSNTASAENLIDFPVMVNLSRAGTDFWSHVGSSYKDLRFVDADCVTDLYFEVEHWNYAEQEAYVWVRVPQIDAGSSTDFIYVYYGNPSPPEWHYHNPTQVWDNNFVMLQHLEETSGTQYDSTNNHNDGTPYGSMNKDIIGKIDGADDFDDVDDYVEIPHSTSLNYDDVVTFELWINPHGSFKGGIDKGTDTCYILGKGDGYLRLGKSGTGTLLPSASPLPYNSWSYVAAVKNQQDMKIYINGGINAEGTTSTVCQNNAESLQIGLRPHYNEPLNSIVDEVRISNTARTAAWISASYHSGSDSLLTYGSEETPSEAPTFLNIATNTTHASNPCEFQVKWSDPDGLDTCLFTTNNTGAWQQNQTIAVSGTESWANITKILNSTPGLVISFRWYCNDTKGNIGDTGIQTLTTSGDWQYAMKLTFNNTASTERLIDFPVMVNLSRAGIAFWSHINPNHKDLRFVDADCVTDLYFEVEYWNYTEQEAYVWVKVPQIDAGSSTDFIYVYYGNPSPPESPYQDPAQVWDGNFVMVQHLQETSGTHYDSTINNNDGTSYGAINQDVTGQVDGADDFDGTDDYIDCGSSTSLRGGPDGISIEAWIYPRSGSLGSGQQGTIIEKRNPTEARGDWGVYLTDNKVYWRLYNEANEGAANWGGNMILTADTWYYIVVNYDDSSGVRKIYINAIFDAQNTRPTGITSNSISTNPVTVGKNTQGDFKYFDGVIDEVRISNNARSGEWVEAQYLSTSDQYVTFGGEQAPNNPPDKPTNPNPPDGATGIPTSVTLSVNVTDPDGDAMDVYFYHVATQGEAPENFTIIALPDTQYYCQSYPGIFDNQTQWVVDNAESMNIVFVTHEGDIIQNWGTVLAEWENANHSMSKLDDNVPYGFCAGNHDEENNGPNTDWIGDDYFPESRYSDKNWWVDGYVQNKNNAQNFSVSGMDFIVVHIEYEANSTTLDWANSILQNNSNRRAIITTHHFLDSNGERCAWAQTLWNNVVVPNDNVFMVLCGHVLGEARRTDTVNGRNVYQMLADYQGRTNGGNGWLRTLKFCPAEDKIYVKTYSPYLDSYETDSGSEFTLDYGMTGSSSAGPSLIGIAPNVSSGEVASVEWTGLNYSTTYRWYAVAVDTDGVATQSDTWNFTTCAYAPPPPEGPTYDWTIDYSINSGAGGSGCLSPPTTMFIPTTIIVSLAVIYLFNRNQLYKRRLKRSLRLGGKRGLIAVATVMGIVVLTMGAIAVASELVISYYGYTVGYQINPLTGFETLNMSIAGGTEGNCSWGNTTSYIDTLNVSKPVYVNFYVRATNTTSLAEHYRNINFTVKIYRTSDDELVQEITLELVKDGCGQGNVHANTTLLDVSNYGIIKQVHYQTHDVSEVNGNFTINIWAEEG